MSRESDSSSSASTGPSSGPQGRGGAAYPSGTPPYGTRPFPSLHPQERPRPAGEPEPPETEAEAAAAAAEPRTETTLTTRIRINIPGSRPIPPVVVRTPVEDGAVPAAEPAAPAEPDAPGGSPADADGTGGPDAPGGSGGPGKKETSDWFAPRKPVGSPPPGADPAAGAAPGAGSAPGPVPGSASGADQGFGTGGAGTAFGADPAFGADSAFGTDPGFGTGGADPAFGADQGFGGQDSDTTATTAMPVIGEPGPGGYGAGTSAGAGRGPGAGAPGGPDPYADPFAEAFTSPPLDQGGPGGVPGAPGGARGGVPGGSPFADPDTGSTQVPTPTPYFGSGDAGPSARGPHDTPAGGTPVFGTEDFPPGVPRPTDPFADRPGPGQGPAGPTSGPATGRMQVPPVAGGPGAPAHPGVGAGGQSGPGGHGGPGGQRGPGGFPPPEERVSGDTLVSGIPRVPSSPGDGRGPRPAPAGERIPTGGPAAASQEQEQQKKPAAARPAKKGRSKLVLLAAGVGVIAAVAYGAGLLMNHADVPKGTTVLGVDIGNMNQDAAVKSLDKSLGNRATAPITLTVGGKKESLKPSVAGLSIDTDATVRKVAHADYNPVSVIGSLFGGSRVADPVYLVDNDKLKSALKEMAGRNSSASDGMVKFEDGQAIAVPGKPGTSFDVDSAATQVAAAYRTRAETGADQPVALQVTTVRPKVTQAALDKAVNGFGKTAMAGLATVQAKPGIAISFGPTKSLPKFLTMVPDQTGTLQPHIDLAVMKSLYGKTFKDVTLKRSDGSVTPVTPQDVATALIKALDSTTDRVVTLPGVVG